MGEELTKYKTVKRKAEVGERILITDKRLGSIENGDIGVVSEIVETGVFAKFTGKGVLGAYHSEYEVIIENADEGEEADGMENVKSLKEIVEQLRSCGYTCEAGPLENNADFQLLERIAGVEKSDELSKALAGIGKSAREVGIAFANVLGKLPAMSALTRDELVEKAKRDVAELLVQADHAYAKKVERVVNHDKRTVVVLLKGKHSGKVFDRGIANCAPDDCFNSHIGKAISLRRALGLEVPAEYLNAPQPTEVHVGDVVQSVKFGTKLKIARKANGNIYDANGLFFYESRIANGTIKIIDDSREVSE